MRDYVPRRAGKRWLESAPEYVLDCFDNHGQSADRYTVIFGKQFLCKDGQGTSWLSLLDMSPNPTHPQGIGLSAEYKAHQIAAYRYRNGHYRVKWSDLPEEIQECVKHWAEQE